MYNIRKIYYLIVFCIIFQVVLSIGLKSVLQYLGNDINLISTIIIYSVALFLNGVYAILWQNVLKVIDLSLANSMMAIVPCFIFVAGTVLFNEEISLSNILGFCLVIIGLLLILNSKGTLQNAG